MSRSTWFDRFGLGGFLRKSRAGTANATRQRRLGFEQLEPLTMLSGVPGVDPNILPMPEMARWAPENLATMNAQDWALLSAVSGAWAGLAPDTLTDQWVVALQDGVNSSALGFFSPQSVTAAPYLQNAYVVDLPTPTQLATFSFQASFATGIDFFYPLIAVQHQARIGPPSALEDPLFNNQWHLRNIGQSGGTAGNDANVIPVWADDILGTGVVIGIVDDGLQYTHPDLNDNYRASLSHDFNDNDIDPFPNLGSDFHGTAVAGVAAAEFYNFEGGSGAAPDAFLAGLRLIAGPTTDATDATALTWLSQSIDIYNNSWGPADDGSLHAVAGPLTYLALQDGVTNGRGGLGNIYVWAAGNGGYNDNVNYDAYANNRWTIAVTAIDHNGFQSSYSENGAPILVSAHSSGSGVGITTTDLLDANGYNVIPGGADPEPNLDYTSIFGGTSSAAPLVSGVIALMLEANPNLSYRDFQHILVETASKNDPTDAGWAVNGAGHDVNHKYGFGAIDAEAAVAAALTWQTVDPEVSRLIPDFVGQGIPDFNLAGISSTIEIIDEINVEWVEVTYDGLHSARGDLEITLVSPNGTRSILSEFHSDDEDDHDNWTFTTARNWGESALGEWKLEVRDRGVGDFGTWNYWVINIYGTAPAPNAGTLDLVVNANDPGGNGADNSIPDEFRIVRNGGYLEIHIDGNLSSQTPFSTVRSVTVNGSNDDDTFIVDHGGGFLSMDVDVHGGLGVDDSLRINGNVGAGVTGLYETGAPDANGNSGTISYFFGAASNIIGFTGLEPVEDLMVAQQFTIEDTTAANVLNIVDGPDSVGLDPNTGAVAGTYQVNFGGAAEEYNFRNKTNVVVNGLAGADAYTMNLLGPNVADALMQLTIVADAGDTFDFTSPGFNRGTPLNVLFDGVAGTSAMLLGSPLSEYALLRPGFARLDGGGYKVTVKGPQVTTINSGGGPGERVDFIDAPGNDVFTVNPAQGRLTGAGFDLKALGFDQYWGYATGGGADDRADIFDSAGNDMFQSFPTNATMTGPGYFAYAGFFDRFFAYAQNGGNDRADVHGSNGNDRLQGFLTHIKLQGPTVFTEASGFEFLFGYAEGGTGDRADLFDSVGNETFYSDATQAYLYNSTFFNAARGFDQVFAHATSGGNDVADLFDSAGNDTFYADPFKAYLYNATFLVQVAGFDAVVGHASTGIDRADLFDSSGNDVFDGFPTDARMSGMRYANSAVGFDRVYGHAVNGGSDDHGVLRESTSLDEFFGRTNFGQFTNFVSFFYFLQGFDRITLFSDINGPDRVDVAAVDYLFTRVGSTGLV